MLLSDTIARLQNSISEAAKCSFLDQDVCRLGLESYWVADTNRPKLL